MSIQTAKDKLVAMNGSLFTCCTIFTYCRTLTKEYEEFVAPLLDGHTTLRRDFDGERLSDEEVLIKRYLVLDFFEQEMRAIGKIK